MEGNILKITLKHKTGYSIDTVLLNKQKFYTKTKQNNNRRTPMTKTMTKLNFQYVQIGDDFDYNGYESVCFDD